MTARRRHGSTTRKTRPGPYPSKRGSARRGQPKPFGQQVSAGVAAEVRSGTRLVARAVAFLVLTLVAVALSGLLRLTGHLPDTPTNANPPATWTRP